MRYPTLLAIDLDGTLLDSRGRVPPRNRDALHRAHAAGVKIVLCTGRSFFETAPVLREIGLDLDAAVTVFGAVICDAQTGRTLDRTPIPLDAARSVTAWFAARGYAILWLLDRDEAAFDGYLFEGPRGHPACDRWIEMSRADVRRLGTPAGGAESADREGRSIAGGGRAGHDIPPRSSDGGAGAAVWSAVDPRFAPVRISVIDEPASLEPLSAALRGAFDGRLTHNVLRAPSYDLTVIESFAPTVNKWCGIRKLCERWGIDPRHTVAVGDDVNDIDMLRNAGLGVAMGNAHPLAKAAAKRVTARNDACGVADVIDDMRLPLPC